MKNMVHKTALLAFSLIFLLSGFCIGYSSSEVELWISLSGDSLKIQRLGNRFLSDSLMPKIIYEEKIEKNASTGHKIVISANDRLFYNFRREIGHLIMDIYSDYFHLDGR